jgi:hypothetical protein
MAVAKTLKKRARKPTAARQAVVSAAKRKRDCLQGVMKFTMQQYKKGTLKNTTGYPVTSRSQALAVGYERSNKTCGKIPNKKETKVIVRQRKHTAAAVRAAKPTYAKPLLKRTVIVRGQDGRLHKRVVYVKR